MGNNMASVERDYERRGNAKKKKSKSVKQRMRSIKRLLDKPDLPANVRVSQERMLDLLQNTLAEEQQSKRDAKMVKKYKMVKFFEKRKLWRQQRALTKDLKSSPSTTRMEELEKLQKKIQRDINYIEYFPRDRKYISLFPTHPYTNPNVISEQEELYEHINEKVDAGELPQAKFGKNVDDATPKTKRKGKLSRLSIHMGKKSGTSTNSGPDKDDFKTSLADDDFFMDTSGNPANVD